MAFNRELFRALRFTARDRGKMATVLARYHRDVYTRTLEEILAEHGRTDKVTLGTQVRQRLRDAAEQQARLIVSSFNADLEEWMRRHDELPDRELLPAVEEWMHQRAERQAPVVSITETYAAHADAVAHFYMEAGLAGQVLFEFGGHGDADPACPICKAIAARNPHPLQRMLAIGTPHPRCRQNWRETNAGDLSLPNVPFAGLGDVAGIVGRESMIQRAGSVADAVRAVEALQ